MLCRLVREERRVKMREDEEEKERREAELQGDPRTHPFLKASQSQI